MKPGSPAWEKRLAELLALEYRQPFGWWYVTFRDGRKFNGAAVVRAQGFHTSILRCHALGIHPGCEAVGIPLDMFGEGEEPRPENVNRLLTRVELDAIIALEEAAAAAVQ